ncbi:acyltransferase [Pediococcus pentosaceus]|uniref:acyltransferase n=1 Tax=Pediococcus pentosaceus TaxID=1255 RepID=UPI0023B13E8F|nr:hypothetical protein [Pediococcus pentosaceus]MDE7512279.1 hypothetical protein [Pediococcus pentosaceus]
MENITKFYDQSIEVSEFAQSNSELGVFDDNTRVPVVKFNNILKEVRTQSKKTVDLSDEIAIVEVLKQKLAHLGKEFHLPKEHFYIDNTGATLLIKSGRGQHYISPTHFENGAYLSSPHYDHELNYSVNELPKLHIGKYTRFGKGASVNIGADIFIGDYVWLAPGSVLLRQEHDAYGQPSIGARTVAMTKQPAIHISDYAWVGRDVIVGWGAKYIGKASIVGARSFINKWVGDYSIVGDHSKILRYLPYKAYLMEYYNPSINDVLRISDWNKVYKEWIKYYHTKISDYDYSTFINDYMRKELELLDGRKNIAVIEPDTPNFLEILPGSSNIDVLVKDQKLTPFILQKAQNLGYKNVRVRNLNVFNQKFPMLDRSQFIAGKETGYDVIMSSEITEDLRENLADSLKSTGYFLTHHFKYAPMRSL